MWRSIQHPAVVPIGLFMLIVGCCYAGIITFLNAYGSLMPAAQAIAVLLVPQSQMGTGISTLFLLLDGGVAFGPSRSVTCCQRSAMGAIYEVLALVVLLAAAFYFFIHGPRQQFAV